VPLRLLLVRRPIPLHPFAGSPAGPFFAAGSAFELVQVFLSLGDHFLNQLLVTVVLFELGTSYQNFQQDLDFLTISPC